MATNACCKDYGLLAAVLLYKESANSRKEGRNELKVSIYNIADILGPSSQLTLGVKSLLLLLREILLHFVDGS